MMAFRVYSADLKSVFIIKEVVVVSLYRCSFICYNKYHFRIASLTVKIFFKLFMNMEHFARSRAPFK